MNAQHHNFQRAVSLIHDAADCECTPAERRLLHALEQSIELARELRKENFALRARLGELETRSVIERY